VFVVATSTEVSILSVAVTPSSTYSAPTLSDTVPSPFKVITGAVVSGVGVGVGVGAGVGVGVGAGVGVGVGVGAGESLPPQAVNVVTESNSAGKNNGLNVDGIVNGNTDKSADDNEDNFIKLPCVVKVKIQIG